MPDAMAALVRRPDHQVQVTVFQQTIHFPGARPP